MRPELAQLRLQKLFSSPEELLTSPHGFGLQTAEPLQRALSYVMCGAPVPAHYFELPEVAEAFGGVLPKPGQPEAIVCAAIRCAKTLEACVGVTWATQKVEMPPGIRPGEVPRVSIVSKYTDQAEAAFSYLEGAFTTSEPLRALLLEEPKNDRILVRHPSGVPIEIMVVAGARSGTTLISRWMAGMIFDEAPRIASEADGVVNLEAMRSAVIGRMLKGSVVIYVGSPVGATGVIYDLVSKNWENPDQQITVVRAKGPSMNPLWWTPEKCEDLKKRDPDSYKTDVLAQFLDPESNLFTSDEVNRSMRLPEPIRPEPGRKYTACMDPATRGNSWTFGIADTTDNRNYRVVFMKQWTGSQAAPLDSFVVIGEIKEICDLYKVPSVLSDQYAVDPFRDIARRLGLEISPVTINAPLKTKMFLGLKARFSVDAIEILKDDVAREDLLRVKRRLSPGGDVSIRFDETADGRHADYAAMLAMLCGTYIEESPAADQQTSRNDDDDWPELDEQPRDEYQEADLW